MSGSPLPLRPYRWGPLDALHSALRRRLPQVLVSHVRAASPAYVRVTYRDAGPADLTITGFDGIAEASRAGLTTVHQPVLEKGKVAGKLLLEANDRIEPKMITLPTELRIGTTSAPPRTAEEQWFGP